MKNTVTHNTYNWNFITVKMYPLFSVVMFYGCQCNKYKDISVYCVKVYSDNRVYYGFITIMITTKLITRLKYSLGAV